MADPHNTSAATAQPWWKHGFVWLVIAGPVLVVLASVATFVVAARGSDLLVRQDSYRAGAEIHRQPARERALLPALQGRNHAATPTTIPPVTP